MRTEPRALRDANKIDEASASTDNELVRRCLAGQSELFGRLVDRYQSKIYRLALGITGNAEDAMDATQNAFLKAFQHLSTFNPSYRFFSWIYRIGMNEALNLRERSGHSESLAWEPETREADPEDQLAGREVGGEIRRALQRLTPDLRTVIVLRHLEDLSYAEIAEVVGIEVKTVKSRLFSARRELRQILVERGLDPR